jgi:hypothetical protein
MKKKQGDLPGRYVPPYTRRWPGRPGEYIEVSDYQDNTDPPPAPLEAVPRQGELDLQMPPG